MNYTRSVFLISDACRAVMTSYEPGELISKRKMFKTFDKSIEVDDYVVVPTGTRHKMTVVKVVSVDVDPDLDNPEPIDWIIDVVDRGEFEQNTAQEAEALQTVKKAEIRRKRNELREALIGDAEAEKELAALPIYSQSSPKQD